MPIKHRYTDKTKEIYYNVKELSKILPISQLTIRKYIREGIIPGGKKIGQNWWISEMNLKAYLSGDSSQDKEE